MPGAPGYALGLTTGNPAKLGTENRDACKMEKLPRSELSAVAASWH
jgi:hypothetical protein